MIGHWRCSALALPIAALLAAPVDAATKATWHSYACPASLPAIGTEKKPHRLVESSLFDIGYYLAILMPEIDPKTGVAFWRLSRSDAPFGLYCKYDKFVDGTDIVIDLPDSVAYCESAGRGGVRCRLEDSASAVP